MKLEDFKVGDLIIVTDTIRCMNEGEIKLVKKANTPKNDLLYIDCKFGKHFLDGLIDDETGEIKGIEKI